MTIPLRRHRALLPGRDPGRSSRPARPTVDPTSPTSPRCSWSTTDHVAISNQFLAKTAANLAENPLACCCAPTRSTFDSYKLLVRHERTEQDGALFESARASIDAIAALTGMDDVFPLRPIDVFRVARRRPVAPAPPPSPS